MKAYKCHVRGKERYNPGGPCSTGRYSVTQPVRDTVRVGGKAISEYNSWDWAHSDFRPPVDSDIDLDDPVDPDGWARDSDDEEDDSEHEDDDGGGPDDSDRVVAADAGRPLQPMMTCGLGKALEDLSKMSVKLDFASLDPPAGPLRKCLLRIRAGRDCVLGDCPVRKRPATFTRSAAEVYTEYISCNMSEHKGEELWQRSRHPLFQPEDLRTARLRTFDRKVQEFYGGDLEIHSIDFHQGL